MIRFRKKTLVFSLALLLLFFLSVSQSLFLSKIKTTFLDIFKFPLKQTHNALSEIKLIFSFPTLYGENKRLKKEIASLRQKVVDFQEASKENERLKKLLDFKNKSPFSTVAARVIGRASSNWASALIIDKGKNSNLEIGMPVISETGLVGRIVEVGKTASQILLINDPNFQVAALIQDSRDEGVVSGSLRGICRMYFISLESNVEVNDLVVTSGLGGVFPKGLLIGRVIEVEVDSSGLMKNCLIMPAANLSRLEEVSVIFK